MGDSARELLAHVWKLMGLPCGKYFVVMLPGWLPLLLEAGDLPTPSLPLFVVQREAMFP